MKLVLDDRDIYPDVPTKLVVSDQDAPDGCITMTLYNDGFEGASIWLNYKNMLTLYQCLEKQLIKRGVQR